jgi:hypothetical protein
VELLGLMERAIQPGIIPIHDIILELDKAHYNCLRRLRRRRWRRGLWRRGASRRILRCHDRRGNKSETGSQMTEVRCRKADDGRRMTEGGIQKGKT